MRYWLIVIVLALTVQRSSAQEPFWAYGPTKVSCGAWTAATGSTRVIYNWWLWGFVSGVSYRDPAVSRQLGNTDGEGLARWVTKYCTENPLDPSVTAAIALIAELKTRDSAK
jgi:hypothetical protein